MNKNSYSNNINNNKCINNVYFKQKLKLFSSKIPIDFYFINYYFTKINRIDSILINKYNEFNKSKKEKNIASMNYNFYSFKKNICLLFSSIYLMNKYKSIMIIPTFLISFKICNLIIKKFYNIWNIYYDKSHDILNINSCFFCNIKLKHAINKEKYNILLEFINKNKELILYIEELEKNNKDEYKKEYNKLLLNLNNFLEIEIKK